MLSQALQILGLLCIVNAWSSNAPHCPLDSSGNCATIVFHNEGGNVALDADTVLSDYDCIRQGAAQPTLLPWGEWLTALEDNSRGDGWLERSLPVLHVLADVGNRAKAVEECPLGLLMADILQALSCYHRFGTKDPSNCYHVYDELVRDGLSRLGMTVLMGTRWQVYDALNSDVWASPHSTAHAEATAAHLDCFDITGPILDWEKFQKVFDGNNWYQPAVDVAYGPELEKHWRSAASECPLGFTVANLVKAMLCAHTESICFRAHAHMVEQAIRDTPLHLIAGSGWPVLKLLGHVSKQVRRHSFHLDFTPAELLSALVGQQKLPHFTSESMQDVQRVLPLVWKATSEPAAGQKVATHRLQLTYVTMAHGPRFSPYVGRFITRAHSLGITNTLIVFCLDTHAYTECRIAGGLCVRGTPSILNKFTLPLVLLAFGLHVMWLDLDVFLFHDPTPYVVEQLVEGSFEILVSGSFAVDCVCSGIVVYRNSPRTHLWLTRLLKWMYEHPYEHDQKAFSAFLFAGERVAFPHELPLSPEEVPRWHFLDPENQFVSARHVDVAGWTGDPDKIVAFHLLHGDSDDAFASRQFAARFGLGVGYTPLLDLFFNQTDIPELYTTPVLPHHASPVLLEALWRSRWDIPRPLTPGRCNETVPMRY